jgi:ATP-binding protein involved in chromosome partitioning
VSQNELLSRFQNLESALPQELVPLFKDLPWSTRVHAVEEDKGRGLKISFYSDGLTLTQKSAIEAFLKKECGESNLLVYFTRKNAPNASSGSTKPPQEERTQASSQGQRPVSPKKAIPGVKRIIAVASGKGGVGKSTVSVNLALSLYAQGYKVGLLDADIYGPSLPMMLNIYTHPSLDESNKIIPPEAYGLKVMSFGFFAPEEAAIIWRGPMIMKALQQFFWDVNWGDLDFLIIDLPPGTGDAQLTLVQSLPLTGAVIVTTPQNVALLDAVKGIMMFEKTGVPIIGLIENMSTYTCPTCHTESFIFGTGGAKKVEDTYQIPTLGHIPLLPDIRAAGDKGTPLTAEKALNPIKEHFLAIAEEVVKRTIAIETTSSSLNA